MEHIAADVVTDACAIVSQEHSGPALADPSF